MTQSCASGKDLAEDIFNEEKFWPGLKSINCHLNDLQILLYKISDRVHRLKLNGRRHIIINYASGKISCGIGAFLMRESRWYDRKLPEMFNEYFKYVSNIHNYDAWQSMHFYVPHVLTNMGQYCGQFIVVHEFGTQLWIIRSVTILQKLPLVKCGNKLSTVASQTYQNVTDISTVTSWWARCRLKSPASRLFAQQFVQAQIKESIKGPHHWPLWGGRWISRTKGQ